MSVQAILRVCNYIVIPPLGHLYLKFIYFQMQHNVMACDHIVVTATSILSSQSRAYPHEIFWSSILFSGKFNTIQLYLVNFVGQ